MMPFNMPDAHFASYAYISRMNIRTILGYLYTTVLRSNQSRTAFDDTRRWQKQLKIFIIHYGYAHVADTHHRKLASSVDTIIPVPNEYSVRE